MSDVPEAHFGQVENTPVDWRKVPDDSPDDDEQPARMSPYIVAMLGFDPLSGAGVTERRDEEFVDAIASVADRMNARTIARADGGDVPGNGAEPYGDVDYADPGYQMDKKKRYPISTAEKIRSAWDYIHKTKDADRYTAEQRRTIESRIVAAWRKKIDPAGPPKAR